MRVITYSRAFPAKHPRKGEPTYFVEKIWEAGFFTHRVDGLADEYMNFIRRDESIIWPKYHTIRAGNRWNVGDWFSPRVWSGKPYASKQIEFAPPIQIKKIWSLKFYMGEKEMMFSINGIEKPIDYRKNIHCHYKIMEMSKNDGLDLDDFMDWFKYPKAFDGQIICWNDKIEY